MQNTFYSSTVLDNDFEELLNEKKDLLQQKYDDKVLKKISLHNVIKVANVLKDIKPKSKMRDHKKLLLQYLDYMFSHKAPKLTNKDVHALMQKHIFQSNYYMRDSGYVQKGLWKYSVLFALIIDTILLFTGISNYYYYIPVFGLLSFFRSYRKELKAKKEGKLLDW